MSAAEAEDLRDACRAMAEIVYQKWSEEQENKTTHVQ